MHSAERGTAVQLTPLPPRHPQMTEGGTADGLGADTLKQALLTFVGLPSIESRAGSGQRSLQVRLLVKR